MLDDHELTNPGSLSSLGLFASHSPGVSLGRYQSWYGVSTDPKSLPSHCHTCSCYFWLTSGQYIISAGAFDIGRQQVTFQSPTQAGLQVDLLLSPVDEPWINKVDTALKEQKVLSGSIRCIFSFSLLEIQKWADVDVMLKNIFPLIWILARSRLMILYLNQSHF